VTKQLVGAHRREIIPAEHEFLGAEPGECAANDAEWKIDCVTGGADRVGQQLDFEPHSAERCARECLLQLQALSQTRRAACIEVGRTG